MHLVHILYRNPGKFIISQKQSISEEFRIQNTQFLILNSPNCSEGLLGDRVVGGFEQADCNPMLEKSKRKMLGGLRNENVSLRIYWKLWNWNCHGWVLQWTEERLNNSSVQLRRRISGTHVAETVIPVGFGFIDIGPVRASPLTWERERETHTHTHTHTEAHTSKELLVLNSQKPWLGTLCMWVKTSVGSHMNSLQNKWHPISDRGVTTRACWCTAQSSKHPLEKLYLNMNTGDF